MFYPEYVSGNQFFRPNHLPKKGDFVQGHTHNFDHNTFIQRGSILIEAEGPNGEKQRLVKRASDEFPWVLIRAEWKHRIEALEDDTFFHCIYAHRTPQGRIVQEYTGWEEAYR